ncbi:hypothetical protein Taro_045677 [Colocasia esculenta]|uniref:Saposin B-type domain-containing protein n=1 Tax=Colocasia esculenta TaxID=4460 RepID=A0A843WRW9_COLES|nr:hypothetical protein [Colocasia esculenta]
MWSGNGLRAGARLLLSFSTLEREGRGGKEEEPLSEAAVVVFLSPSSHSPSSSVQLSLSLSLSICCYLSPQHRVAALFAGVMGPKVGVSFLLSLMIISCIYCDARSLQASDPSVSETTPAHELATGPLDEYEKSQRMCILCEQFAGQAMEYLKENRTQSEIIDTFHNVCVRLRSFQQQCLMLVDYYAPLLFLEVALVRPYDFCRRVNLCEDMAPPPPAPASPLPPVPSPPSPPVEPLMGERLCSFCNNTVFNFLARLRDPGTELKIVEGLVKGCVVTENFAQKCQNLIFQYGPVILTNFVRILERADICVAMHACKESNQNETTIAMPYASPVQLPLFDM